MAAAPGTPGNPGGPGMGGAVGPSYGGFGFGFGSPRMAWDNPQALAALDFLGIQGGNPYQRGMNFYKQFAGQNGVPRMAGGEAFSRVDPNMAVQMAMMRMMQSGAKPQASPIPALATQGNAPVAVQRLAPRPVLSSYQGQGALMRRFG